MVAKTCTFFDVGNVFEIRVEILIAGHRADRYLGIVRIVVTDLNVPVEAGDLLLDLFLKPTPVATEKSMTTMPMAMARMEMRMMGEETLFLYRLEAMILLAINNS